jgi:hypothetical protein
VGHRRPFDLVCSGVVLVGLVGGSCWWVLLVGLAGGSCWWVLLVGLVGGSCWWVLLVGLVWISTDMRMNNRITKHVIIYYIYIHVIAYTFNVITSNGVLSWHVMNRYASEFQI